MIQIQQKDKSQFDMHPWHVQPSSSNIGKKQHPISKETSQNGGGPSNDIP
jgi:hypothetical protein